MRRVADFRDNAKACRDLARKMPAVQRDQLLEMAVQWDRLAEERERTLKLDELGRRTRATPGPTTRET